MIFKHELPRIDHEFIINGKLYGQLHGNYMLKEKNNNLKVNIIMKQLKTAEAKKRKFQADVDFE